MTPIRVLVVDDSAVARQVLTGVLQQDPAIRVAGAAADPLFALNRMRASWPDVLVLDVDMPRMDGITFLKKIMAERPTPVVICSSLTTQGARTTVQALEAGAVTVIAKPRQGVRHCLLEFGDELTRAVKMAARAKVGRPTPARLKVGPKLAADAILAAGNQAMAQATERVVAIGTSTGGTQALEEILCRLPAVCPGLVVVQHMPEKFTAAFAHRLNQLSALEVKEAAQGDRVLPGRALIAPGGRHMLLKRNGVQYVVEVVDGPPVNRHRPSVDVLFRSAARFAGRNATGIILTGMGDDGARGLKEMRDAGASTVAQDEASCVVYGMPKEAVKLNAVDRIAPLAAIPEIIMRGLQ